jgi:hypothetical protein
MSNNTWAAFGILPGRDEDSVQSSIPPALSYLCERDQRAFAKKFSEQSGNNDQAMHTFRELLAGAFMARQGYTPFYEPSIDGLTPDWLFRRAGQEEFIADVVNFHVARTIESKLERAFDEGQTWCGEIPDQSQRLHSSLWEKAGKYKNLAAQKSMPYVVFIFGWLNAIIEPDQVETCLVGAEGLFNDYTTLSGVYHMRERTYKTKAEVICIGTQMILVPKERPPSLLDAEAGYCFDYYANPKASYPVRWLSNGALAYRFPACSDQPTQRE